MNLLLRGPPALSAEMCCFAVFPEQTERPWCRGWNTRSDALWWFKEGNEEAHCDPLKLLGNPGEEIWNYPKRDLMTNGGLTPNPVDSSAVTNSQALSFICLPVALHPAAQGTWVSHQAHFVSCFHGIADSIWRGALSSCSHLLLYVSALTPQWPKPTGEISFCGTTFQPV